MKFAKWMGAGALLLASALALAQPAKVMIPANAGGGWDGTGRLVFDVLQKTGIYTEGASFTNKGGAAGTLGLADFIKNKGQDNAVMVTGVVMVGGIITNKSPVNLDMTTPLARLTYEFNVIGVPADSPIKNAQDFVSALKADPGAMAVGGGSAGGIDHITLALIAGVSGVPTEKLNYVAFASGAEVATSLAGGKIKAAISGLSELKSQADAGRIRLIAISSEKGRSGIASLKEQGVDVVTGNWRGLVGPPEMTEAGRKAWLERFDRMVKTPEWRAGLAKAGLEDAYLGEGFGSFLKAENERWTRVLNALGLVKK
jgi:putative tricarboxylic transport membrane protein